jgi:hypothetical protein
MTTKFIVSNDIGTTRVKSLAVYASRQGKAHRVELDSVLGEPRELLGSDPDLMAITTAEGDWFVGQSALLHSRHHISGRDKRWPFSPFYRALHLYAIARHVSPTTPRVTVDLISALPFSDRAGGKEIAASLKGSHAVTIPGHQGQLTIQIENVYFSIQGIAALMAEGYGDETTVAWLGLGGRNKTFATISQGQIITDKTNSHEGGMLTALDDFRNRVRQDTDLDLSEVETIEAMRAGYVLVGVDKVPVEQHARAAIEPYRDSVRSLISQIWPVDYMGRVRDLRIGGGGALGIGQALSQEIRQARVVDDPRWTEAAGLLNLGLARFG